MDKKQIKKKVEKLFSRIILPIKRLQLYWYERKLIRLADRGATAEEIIWIKILHRGVRNRIHTLSQKRGIYELQNLSELFILLIIPHKSAEDALGDIREEYEEKIKKQGQKAAENFVYKQVLGSAWARAKPLISKVAWWLVLAWVANHLI